jgi:hypothetical protein
MSDQVQIFINLILIIMKTIKESINPKKGDKAIENGLVYEYSGHSWSLVELQKNVITVKNSAKHGYVSYPKSK